MTRKAEKLISVPKNLVKRNFHYEIRTILIKQNINYQIFAKHYQ